MKNIEITRAVLALAIATSGGAAGALLMWVAIGQLRVSGAAVGLMLTALGWFVNSGLNRRAQLQLLRHNVVNAARLDIAERIRDEQDWMGDVNNLAHFYRGRLGGPLANDSRKWLEWNQEGRSKLFRERDPGRMLTMVLEEYEILFPETRRVRLQLALIVRQVLVEYPTWLSMILDEQARQSAIAAMESRDDRNRDYAALLDDLRIHVQNAALATVMSRTVPERKPRDENVPLMVMQPDGLLDIVQRGESWPIMTAREAQMLGRTSVHYPD